MRFAFFFLVVGADGVDGVCFAVCLVCSGCQRVCVFV